MSVQDKIDYLELPSKDIEITKDFFAKVFGWSFTDYGPEYVAVSAAGINAGFYKADLVASTANGSVLVVIYSEKLEETQSKIEAASGTIVKEIFDFPGGRRFHFADPNGNEYAVWSDK